MFCTGCIQLENHSCPKLSERIRNEKEKLEKNLVKVVARKVEPI